jgi:hypothetical protein
MVDDQRNDYEAQVAGRSAMTWVTVCWHPVAEAELARMWISGNSALNLEFAANEIDQLLRFRSASKGMSIDPYLLDSETITVLESRRGHVDDEIRRLTFGPLEVYFTSHELDRQAKVWLVRLRDAQSEDQRLREFPIRDRQRPLFHSILHRRPPFRLRQ